MPTEATTTAAILRALGEPVTIEELALPELKPGQVLVDVAYAGLCGTQLGEVRGKRGPDRFLPHTLGHEGAGVVAATGPDVSKVKEGDHVVMSWIKGAGADVPSTTYGGSDGVVNSGAISAFMTRAVVSENRLVPIPPETDLRSAALLGCALPTGAGAVLNTASPPAGARVGVFGVGGVGLSAVVGARLAGAAQIVAVDVATERLGHARAAGATEAIPAGDDVAARILELTDGHGLDCAIECSGAASAMQAAFASVRPGGGLAVLAGNLPAGGRIEIDPFDLIRGKRIVGTWGGESQPDRDIPRFCEMIANGSFEPEVLIGREYPLAEINRGFDELEAGVPGRPLLKLA